jgi:Mn2+/Fe2+ NRAMP family transporter
MPSLPGRHLSHLIARRRRSLLGAGGLATLLAVVGPGILAGLSDDDPAGITTYSVLGAKYGYELIWVLTLSTVALIAFHLLAVRTGLVTRQGLMTLLRERYGRRATLTAGPALLVANLGTLCAEFAGIAAGAELVGGITKYVSVPVAAVLITLLVLRGSFRYVEHVLLLLSTVFVSYIVAGFLAHPDWGAAFHGAVVPSLPLNRDALLIVTATIGTTLAPWGLTFVQSYAVNKGIPPEDMRYESIDVVTGAVLTGVIGLFVVVACAATLHVTGVTINDARDAAAALEPVAGSFASGLFGLGILGAGILAAAIVPLATAYSIAEATGRPADIDDSFGEAREFYLVFIGMMVIAAGIVLIPGAPLVTILVLTQALNAVLLLPILPFMLHVASDLQVMGDYVLGTRARVFSALCFAMIAVSVAALGVLAASSL